MNHTLYSFYRSDEWENFRKIIIAERTREDGFVYDEMTNKPILRKYDLILHHKVELTEENVNDVTISLNPDNIMILSHKSHNIIHDRFCGTKNRRVFLVYGAPLSGKSTFVSENALQGDFIVDIDNIWQSVSGAPRYTKPNQLKQIVFKIFDAEVDAIKYRLGRWNTCYLIGGFPLQAQRKRMCDTLQAREVFIESSQEECLRRLHEADDGRDIKEWEKYIAEWFEEYE